MKINFLRKWLQGASKKVPNCTLCAWRAYHPTQGKKLPALCMAQGEDYANNRYNSEACKMPYDKKGS